MGADLRYLAILIPLVMLGVAGCYDVELPTSSEVKDVFSSHEVAHSLHAPEPENVPVLDSRDLGGWRMLCDQCHNGPNYSSHGFLTWAHNDLCQSEVTCLECHGEKLHRLDVRGSKGICIECHLETDNSVECSMCHVAGWTETHTPEGHMLATHGMDAREDITRCDSCHGSGNWCMDCHGIPMPHPPSILTDHPSLVRGDPQSCVTCHGQKACETCHSERGVEF